MLTSTTATGKPARTGRSSGFSLLEILVVVFLVGLVATVAAPTFVRDNHARDREDAAEAIARMLMLASDYAMFRGQLMAVRLTPGGLEPLLFDLEEYTFNAPAEGAFKALELDEPLLLEWTLDEQQDPANPTLASAVEKLQKSEVKEFGADKATAPQVFLFPSGETTPITLKVIHSDVAGESLVQLDSIGRTTFPGREDLADDDAP